MLRRDAFASGHLQADSGLILHHHLGAGAVADPQWLKHSTGSAPRTPELATVCRLSLKGRDKVPSV